MNLRKNYSKEIFYSIDLNQPYFGISNIQGKDYSININNKMFFNIFLESRDSRVEQVKKLKFYSEKRNRQIVNLFFHYVAKIDKFDSITNIFFREYKSYVDIEKGIYGDFIKKNFFRLSEKNKEIILYHIAEYEANDNKINCYEDVLNELFDDVQLYYDTFEKVLYIAVKQEKNEENVLKYKVCQKLFKSILLKDEILWGQRLITFKENDLITLDYDSYINDLNKCLEGERFIENEKYYIVTKEEKNKTIMYSENEKTKIGNKMMKLI